MPRQYADIPKLGRWVATQRSNYRLHQAGKPSVITEEHIRELDSVGFNWRTRRTDVVSIWSVRFQQLCKFKEQFGLYLVPQLCAGTPKLGRWVSTQRSNYKLYQEGKPTPLTEKHIRELESVEFT